MNFDGTQSSNRTIPLSKRDLLFNDTLIRSLYVRSLGNDEEKISRNLCKCRNGSLLMYLWGFSLNFYPKTNLTSISKDFSNTLCWLNLKLSTAVYLLEEDNLIRSFRLKYRENRHGIVNKNVSKRRCTFVSIHYN